MKEFTKTLKLYFQRDKGLASLSIRNSPTHVSTFYIDQQTFERILAHYRDPSGIEVGPYFIMKKVEYIRFTFNHAQGMQENLRIAIPHWDALIKGFHDQMASSQSSLITCEVD